MYMWQDLRLHFITRINMPFCLALTQIKLCSNVNTETLYFRFWLAVVVGFFCFFCLIICTRIMGIQLVALWHFYDILGASRWWFTCYPGLICIVLIWGHLYLLDILFTSLISLSFQKSTDELIFLCFLLCLACWVIISHSCVAFAVLWFLSMIYWAWFSCCYITSRT